MHKPAKLFICCHATCIAYCDKSCEEHGDYVTIARLYFSDLRLEINKPRSALFPEIRQHADTIIAKRGEQYPVSASQFITLGYALK